MSSRKRFILKISGLFGSIFLLKNFNFWRNEDYGNKVKMLTKKGELVEIDRKDIPAKKRRVSNKELQNWIWGKVRR